MWGWVLLIVTAAFAMPSSLSDAEAPLTGEERASSLVDLFYPLKWMNPLRWMPSFAILRSNGKSPARPTTYLDTVSLNTP